jgi:hypothetical protein
MYQKFYPTTSYNQFPANIYFFAIAKKIIEIGDLNNSTKKILDYGCGEKIFTKLLKRDDIVNYDIKEEYTEIDNYEKSFFNVAIFNHVLMYMSKKEIVEELIKIKRINKNTELILSLSKQNFLSKIAMYLQFKFDAHKDTISSYNDQIEIFFEHCEFIKKKNIFFMTDVFLFKFKK